MASVNRASSLLRGMTLLLASVFVLSAQARSHSQRPLYLRLSTLSRSSPGGTSPTQDKARVSRSSSFLSIAEGQRRGNRFLWPSEVFLSHLDYEDKEDWPKAIAFFFPTGAWTSDGLSGRMRKMLPNEKHEAVYEIHKNLLKDVSFRDIATTQHDVSLKVSRAGSDLKFRLFQGDIPFAGFEVFGEDKTAYIYNVWGRGFPSKGPTMVFTGAATLRMVDGVLRWLRVKSVSLSDASKMGCIVSPGFWSSYFKHEDNIVSIPLGSLQIWATERHQNYYNHFGFEPDAFDLKPYCERLKKHIDLTLEEALKINGANKPFPDEANKLIMDYIEHWKPEGPTASSDDSSMPAPPKADTFTGCTPPSDPSVPLVSDLTTCLLVKFRQLVRANADSALLYGAFAAPPVIKACEALYTWTASFLTPFTESNIQPVGVLHLYYDKLKDSTESPSWSCPV